MMRPSQLEWKSGVDTSVSVMIRYLPQTVNRALRHWCYPALLTAKNHRIRLTRLEGESPEGLARVLVAGPDPWAYDLPLRFISGTPKQIDAGTVPVWRLNSAIARLAPDVDLVMARVDRLTARLFCSSPYLRVPEWIETGRDVPENLNKLVRSTHSLSEDLRLSRHYKLEAEITYSEDDFHDFYHTMYVPFIRARHGMMAWPSNEESLRHCLHRGGIIWLRQAGERVAALLFKCDGDSLHMRADGVLHGDLSILKRGVISALFYHAFQQAAARNCRFVDFGGCRACLTDGVLRYKRKWGISVRVRPGNQFYTLIHWAAWTPAVAAFFRHVPVFHQDADQLVGITATSQAEPATQGGLDKIYQTIFIPGIEKLMVVNDGGWPDGIVPPPATVLIDGCPLAGQLVAA